MDSVDCKAEEIRKEWHSTPLLDLQNKDNLPESQKWLLMNLRRSKN